MNPKAHMHLLLYGRACRMLHSAYEIQARVYAGPSQNSSLNIAASFAMNIVHIVYIVLNIELNIEY